MKGDSRIESILNDCLKYHFQAKDGYRLERHVFANRGYDKLADKIDNRKEVHDSAARKITDRLLFLEFAPVFEPTPPTFVNDCYVFLQNGQIFETNLVKQIAGYVNDTRGIDEGTHRLLGKISDAVEDNVFWFERQIKRYNDIGPQLYLAGMT
jgi:bacterioferritin (cytochrome b1)